MVSLLKNTPPRVKETLGSVLCVCSVWGYLLYPFLARSDEWRPGPDDDDPNQGEKDKRRAPMPCRVPVKDQNSAPKRRPKDQCRSSTLQIKHLILSRLLPPRLGREHNPPPLPPPPLDKKLGPLHPPRRPRPPRRRRARPTDGTRRRDLRPLSPLPKAKVKPVVDDQRRRRRARVPVAAERRPRRGRDGSGLSLLLLEVLLEAVQRALLVEARRRGERRVQAEGVPFDAGAGRGGGRVGAAARGGGAGRVGGGAGGGGGGHGGGVAGLSLVVEVWEVHVGVLWVVVVGWLLGGGRGAEASVAAEAVEDAVGRVVFVLGEAEHYIYDRAMVWMRGL